MKKISMSIAMIIIVMIAVFIGWIKVSNEQEECYQFEPHQKCKTLMQIISEKVHL